MLVDFTKDTEPQNNLSLLELAYKIYSEERIVHSQQEFSKLILGKQPSYLSCMRSRRRKPSKVVLQRLLKSVRLFVFSCQRNPHFGKPHAHRLNKSHRRLEALANTLEQQLLFDWVLDRHADVTSSQSS